MDEHLLLTFARLSAESKEADETHFSVLSELEEIGEVARLRHREQHRVNSAEGNEDGDHDVIQ